MSEETAKVEADINRSRHALNDTLEELGGKLSPGQILDEVLGLAQGQLGTFTANVGRQVRDNPVPLLLIGAGVGMMVMKMRQGESTNGVSHREWHDERRYRKLEESRSGLSKMVGETQEAFAARMHDAEAAALGLTQHAGEAVDVFKSRVKSAGETLGQSAQGVRNRMSAVAAQTGEFVSNQAANLKDAAGQAKEKTQAFYDEYPLAAGAFGVALGALLGATAPLSNMERDSLHGVASTAAKGAADLAEKGAEAVKRASDKAAAQFH